MKYLSQACESEQRLTLLLSLTSISSQPVIQALRDHLQANWRGLSDTSAAALNGVQLPNFNRALKTLNAVAATVEQIKDLDWQHLKSVK